MLRHSISFHVLFVGMILAAFRPGVLPADDKGDAGFVDLFNGEDLSGWVNVNCAPETWSVKDGMIHCTGKPIGALRTERQYENFILELEWRHLKAGGNAGVFIWAGPISARGQPFLRAIEVQVLDHAYGKSNWFTTHGDVFPIHGSRMKPHGRHNGMRSFPSEERSKGSPEWNHYRIECDDGVLRLHVNGKQVSGGDECNWRKGYIALESESSPVDFRNIRIKELPSTGAGDEESAPEAAGHKALYNGTDFRGWAEPKTEGARWVSRGWVIRAGEDTLWTREEYGDGEYIVDWKFPKDAPAGAKAGFRLLGREGVSVEISKGEAGSGGLLGKAPAKRADGKGWNRFQVTVEKGKATVWLNGEVVAEGVELPLGIAKAGRIGLTANNAANFEFANIYHLKK